MQMIHRRLALAGAVACAALVVVTPLGASTANSYNVTNLVSNVPGEAPTTDPLLENAWGLTSSPTSPWWVADNGTGFSTLYTGAGARLSLEVKVDDNPTGAVFNGTAGAFGVVPGGTGRFLFATESGQLLAWPGSGDAVVTKDFSDEDAIFKGLAIAGPLLFATDFHNNRVDMFDGSWTEVGSFTDTGLPAGYAPFGIQTIGSRVFVTFAKQDADAEDEVAGQGLGFVDVFDTSGNLMARVAQHGQLNAPWGLALAPAGFGPFAGDLLVGNFGDGEVSAYAEMANGRFEFRGQLRGADGEPIAIDGLWALEFGNGANAGPTGRLFFTAGPDDESNGLFGSIDPS